VTTLWFTQPSDARADFKQYSGEPVSGVGDEAVWNESFLTLAVLRGTVVLSIWMTMKDNAREQAIKIGEIAAVRVP
jgi:hypothetical protein